MKENGSQPTFFEALTAIALKKFADEKVDIAIIEAGIGGRTDATNVFVPDSLCAAVVTPIAKEHLEHLGELLNTIQGHSSHLRGSIYWLDDKDKL